MKTAEIDRQLARTAERIERYRAEDEERKLEIELTVADRLLDERLGAAR